jgi:hypothetical protein
MSDSLTMQKVVDHLYTLQEGHVLDSKDVHYIQASVSFFDDYKLNRDYNELVIQKVKEELMALKDTVPEVEDIIKRLGYVHL